MDEFTGNIRVRILDWHVQISMFLYKMTSCRKFGLKDWVMGVTCTRTPGPLSRLLRQSLCGCNHLRSDLCWRKSRLFWIADFMGTTYRIGQYVTNPINGLSLNKYAREIVGKIRRLWHTKAAGLGSRVNLGLRNLYTWTPPRNEEVFTAPLLKISQLFHDRGDKWAQDVFCLRTFCLCLPPLLEQYKPLLTLNIFDIWTFIGNFINMAAEINITKWVTSNPCDVQIVQENWNGTHNSKTSKKCT